MLRLKQRKAFLESRILENKAWAANYDEHFGPFVNKYKEFMEQVGGPKVGYAQQGCWPPCSSRLPLASPRFALCRVITAATGTGGQPTSHPAESIRKESADGLQCR